MEHLKRAPNLKWMCGEGFTKNDVLKVFKLSQHSGQVHSGYVNSLSCGHQAADSSVSGLESTSELFSTVGVDVRTATTLPPDEYPIHFTQPPLRTFYGDPGADQRDAAAAAAGLGMFLPPPSVL